MTRLGRTVSNRSIWIFCLVWFPLSLSRSLAGAEAPVLPTPQFHQFLEGELTLPKSAAGGRFRPSSPGRTFHQSREGTGSEGSERGRGRSKGCRTESWASPHEERVQCDPVAILRTAHISPKLHTVERGSQPLDEEKQHRAGVCSRHQAARKGGLPGWADMVKEFSTQRHRYSN